VTETRIPWGTYLRDTIIFLIGAGIVLGQTGFPFLIEQPANGPSIPALITGAVFCNGPVAIQALTILFRISGSREPPDSQGPQSSSSQSSAPL
jgi:hypothetical protein